MPWQNLKAWCWDACITGWCRMSVRRRAPCLPMLGLWCEQHLDSLTVSHCTFMCFITSAKPNLTWMVHQQSSLATYSNTSYQIKKTLDFFLRQELWRISPKSLLYGSGKSEPGLPGSSKKLEARSLENRGSRSSICLPRSHLPAQAIDFNCWH